VNAAANNPADDRFVTSVVNKYDEIDALAEKIGAINTHICLILIVKCKKFATQ